MSEEGLVTFVVTWVVGLFASCFIGGMIGSSVNRFGVGLLLGILGPIGWIIVLLLPRDSLQKTPTHSASNPSQDDKKQVMTAPATRDLADDGYKLYLAEKYSIQRNDVFEKFVCEDTMFPTLAEALTHADSLEARSACAERTAAEARQADQAQQVFNARDEAVVVIAMVLAVMVFSLVLLYVQTEL